MPLRCLERSVSRPLDGDFLSRSDRRSSSSHLGLVGLAPRELVLSRDPGPPSRGGLPIPLPTFCSFAASGLRLGLGAFIVEFFGDFGVGVLIIFEQSNGFEGLFSGLRPAGVSDRDLFDDI